MSAPPGSQPPFSAALPRPPSMMPQLAVPPFGLPPPPGGGASAFSGTSRPIRPSMVPAASGPVVLNPPGLRVAPVALQPKSTTLYVGKIASSVSNDTIKQLLEACGAVKEWKRMEDPETKALKPFGFCEYEEAEGVVRALNLLNNLSIGGQELLLKGNTQTQKYIESIEARNAQRAQEAGDAEETQRIAEEADNEALEKIMSIVSSQAPTLPPPPDAVAAADSFLASLKSDTEHNSRHKDSRRRRESRSSRDDEKAVEVSFQREKERERREAEARQQEQDNAYKSALRKWEAQENDRRKHVDREREHERDRVKERDRLLKADLEGSASDAEEDSWRRKLYAGSRRAIDRKRRREKENQEDELDRDREAEEAVKRAKTVEREEDGQAHSSPAPAAARLEDMNDSITQAMMHAAKVQRKSPVGGSGPSPPQVAAPPKREAVPQARAASKSKAVLAAFGGEEEEEQPKRTLKPISYSEEEQKAALVSPQNAEEKAASVNEIISKVPTEDAAVFSYNINWKDFDEGGPALREKIAKWVLKKTTELLGEEEESMVDFIMAQVQEHVSAIKLLEELQAVLDEEAKPFVFKLYRMVIFETLKQAANLQD